VKEALGFLMTREIAHQKSFEKALYAITPNFPPGKLPGQKEFTNTYFDLSQGEGNMRGPWNEGAQWNFVDHYEASMAVDGGDGSASVDLSKAEEKLLQQAAARTASNPDSDPLTGAELGAGDGKGRKK
jgi:Mn-containing catalase